MSSHGNCFYYALIASYSSGMGSFSTTDLRRAPRRPSLVKREIGHPGHSGTNRATLPSWGVSSAVCSFGDGHRAHTEAKRISKDAERKTSAGQGIQGKVRHCQC